MFRCQNVFFWGAVSRLIFLMTQKLFARNSFKLNFGKELIKWILYAFKQINLAYALGFYGIRYDRESLI